MPKKGQYGTAPYIGLSEGISAITDFYRQNGDKGSKIFLADILGNTPKSSSFTKKISALKAYGLVQETNGDISLTSLALNIVAPTNQNETTQAKVEAFFSVPLFKRMHEKLKGGLLPKSDMLKNFLSKDFAILPKDADAWAIKFEESLRVVDLLSRKGTNWVILEEPTRSTTVEMIPNQEKKITQEEPVTIQGEWREYTHPMGRLRIRVDAPPKVVNEFISFLKFVILGENEEENE